MAISQGKLVAPISVAEVSSYIGDPSLDVGTLCTSNQINKWSRVKPIDYPSLKPLPDSAFTSQNGGFNPSACVYNSYQQMARVAAGQEQGNQEWTYAKPKGGISSPYRLTDFNGYDHYARCPFALTIESALVGGNLQATTTIDVSLMEEWGFDLAGFTFGLWIPGKGVYMMSTVNNINDMEGRELHFNVPLPASGIEYGDVNFTAGTTYTARVIMTNFWSAYTSEQGQRWYASPGNESVQSEWYLLPTDTVSTFTPAAAPTVLDKVTLEMTSGSAVYSEPNGLPTYSNIQISAKLTVASGVSGTWNAQVDFIAQNVVGNNNVTGDRTVATWSSITITSSAATLTKSLSYAGSLEMAAFPKDESEFQLQMQLTLWQSGGQTYVQTQTVYLNVTTP